MKSKVFPSVNDTLTESDHLVLQYIIDHKDPPGEDVRGHLQESLGVIAEQVARSVTTVHRAIKEWRNRGVIRVIPPVDKTHPNIIEYIGKTGSTSAERELDNILGIVRELQVGLSAVERRIDSVLMDLRKNRVRYISGDIQEFKSENGMKIYVVKEDTEASFEMEDSLKQERLLR